MRITIFLAHTYPDRYQKPKDGQNVDGASGLNGFSTTQKYVRYKF